MQYIDYILGFSVGWILASWYCAYRIRKVIKDLANQAGIELDEMREVKVSIPILVTEYHNDSILLYDKKNNFMCQANSLEELASKLFTHKNIKLAHVVHGEQGLWFVEGKVKTSVNES